MDRRTEIIRRATEVFQRKGVNGTTLEDIARAVGIKREGIYYYFRNRFEILLEVILPQSNALARNLQFIVGSNMAPQDKLRGAIQNHLEGFNPGYLEMSVALREDHFERNPEKLHDLREAWKRYEDLWMELIGEGQRLGVFEPGLSVRAVTYGILGMCNWLSRWYDPGGPLSIGDIIDTYFHMVFYGLETSTETSPGQSRSRRMA